VTPRASEVGGEPVRLSGTSSGAPSPNFDTATDNADRVISPRKAGRPMNTHWRNHLLERLERGDSLEQIDRDLRRIGGLSEEERAALWLLAWGEQQKRAPARRAAGMRSEALTGGSASDRDRRSARGREVVASTLELARAETSMDVAVLGEIHDGREVVRLLAGEAESFGLAIGASLPVEETFCQRLLEGRLDNVVRDAISDERVCDLEVTRTAGIGAYIGVPMTTLDARLYILCCLAHEQQPALGQRDVVFLRGLGETIIRELDTAPLG
jgi:GAF domain-containing protein